MRPRQTWTSSICTLALLCAGAANAGAAEWFVAPGGSGSGTSAAPFGSVQDGIDAAQAGDTITVRAGTYDESLQTARAGTADAPITLRAEAAGTAVIQSSGRVLRVDHAYIIVDGLTLDGDYGDRVALDVNATGSHFTLRSAEVRRSGRDCVDLGAATDVLIEGSRVHHCLNSTGGRTDAHGVTGGPVQRLTLRDTEIHSFSGDAIQFDPSRSDPSWNDILIEGCTLWLEPLPTPENGFAAGTVPGENAVDTKVGGSERVRITIRNTTAHGFRGGLITNMAAFNMKENIDAVFDRVTVYDSEIALRLRGPANVRVKNALVYDVDAAFRYEDDIENLRVWNATVGEDVVAPFVEASSGASVVDVRNSLFVAAALPAEAAGGTNLAVDLSPFDDAANDDYHLVAGTAAIDSGETISDVATDRDGIARPQGGAYDVGAFEYCPTACASADPDAGPTAGTPDAAGSGSGDGGSGTGGGATGGCGCQSTRTAPSGPMLLLFLLATTCLRRRREKPASRR